MNSKLMISVMKMCVWISIIQLPVILLQWQLFDKLPLRFRGGASLVDFGSGTFSHKMDSTMSLFLIFVIIFLLFEKNRNYFIRHKYIIAVWLSLTIIITNSQIMKIALILVWLGYIITNLRIKTLFYLSLGGILLSRAVIYLSKSNLITEEITTFISNLITEGYINIYLKGGYSRVGAIRYLSSEGFTWLGTGPSSYYDPITRILLRGNMGHSFTFFSEIGFLGWLISLLVIFIISFASDSKIQISMMRILIFTSIIILSFTGQIMNDISVFLIFCIMLRINQIPTLKDAKKESTMISVV